MKTARVDSTVTDDDITATADDTVEARITVVNKLGLHARAAAQLVKLAGGFDCAIALSFADGDLSRHPRSSLSGGGDIDGDGDGDGNATAGKTADAKSIMDVMMLAAAQGSELHLSARGRDARAAARAVAELFAARFGEGE